MLYDHRTNAMHTTVRTAAFPSLAAVLALPALALWHVACASIWRALFHFVFSAFFFLHLVALLTCHSTHTMYYENFLLGRIFSALDVCSFTCAIKRTLQLISTLFSLGRFCLLLYALRPNIKCSEDFNGSKYERASAQCRDVQEFIATLFIGCPCSMCCKRNEM